MIKALYVILVPREVGIPIGIHVEVQKSTSLPGGM